MTGCFGSQLDKNYEELIAIFKSKYESLLEYTNMMFPSVKVSVTWKVHALVADLPQFLWCYQTGAVRADYKKTVKRFHF